MLLMAMFQFLIMFQDWFHLSDPEHLYRALDNNLAKEKMSENDKYWATS